jgi:hypothetical protein
MFEGANLLAGDKRKYGQQAVMEIAGDIHEYTELYSPEESVGVPYLNGRQVFDFNERARHWAGRAIAMEGQGVRVSLRARSACKTCGTGAGGHRICSEPSDSMSSNGSEKVPSPWAILFD